MPRLKGRRERFAAARQNTAVGSRSDAKSGLLDEVIRLARQGQYAESETLARQVLRLRPDDVDILNELGAAVWRQGRSAEAEAIYRRACEVRPDDYRVLNNLGISLYDQGHIDEASEYYRRALRCNPDAFDARMNLGVALSDQGKLDEAALWLQSAQELRPRSTEILQNIAVNLTRQGRAPEAIGYYEQILQLRPDHAETHVDLAFALLCAGDYQRGWREHEWRMRTDKPPDYKINRPFWNGEDIHDRTILIHTEQGFGDNLQFIRFAPLVKKRAGVVLALCKTQLLKLIARCNGVDMALDGTSLEPQCDVHVPLLSLPAILGITLETLPAEVPYLVTDKLLVDHWGAELAKAIAVESSDAASPSEGLGGSRPPKPFRIGIAWQGNPDHKNDRWRSFRLAHFAPLAAIPGVRLISLQTGDGLDQLKAADRTFPVIELPGRRFRDFMETAAIMTHLDLVITPDTALAHLAGGLGVRTWTGLCMVDEWRWLNGRADTPWYPTMRLFRQTSIGDWAGVFQRMASALRGELQ